MKHAISTRWIAYLFQIVACGHVLKTFGAHMDILFIVTVEKIVDSKKVT